MILQRRHSDHVRRTACLNIVQNAKFAFCCISVLCVQLPGVAQPESAPLLRGVDLAQPGLQTMGATGSAGALTLADLQRIATQNNPTLAQATASIQAARGRSIQAGLLPNPVVGEQTEEFAFRSLKAKPEYFGFIEQTIPLGHKLLKSKRIYEREVVQAEVESAAQAQRVLNTIRNLYYQLLGAQETVRLETALAKIAQDATVTTSELFNVGQADKPDFLAAQIEQEQVAHELVVAQNNYSQTWRTLVSVLGRPDMPETPVTGSLEEPVPELDENQLYAKLIQQSPQIQAAQAQIAKARAVLVRAIAEPIPDLFVRAGIGYSTEFLENRQGEVIGRTGTEMNWQVGMTLPVFDRNQGAIAAARADLAFSEREVERLKLALRLQLSEEMRQYRNAVDAVARYRGVIVPRAEEAYRLYLQKFQQMAASYPQVLISQRTMFQVRNSYIESLVTVQNRATQLQGFLLTGGLDAPSSQANTAAVHVQISGVRSGSQGGQKSLDTAGLVEN